jgi:hypothetical protein
VRETIGCCIALWTRGGQDRHRSPGAKQRRTYCAPRRPTRTSSAFQPWGTSGPPHLPPYRPTSARRSDAGELRKRNGGAVTVAVAPALVAGLALSLLPLRWRPTRRGPWPGAHRSRAGRAGSSRIVASVARGRWGRIVGPEWPGMLPIIQLSQLSQLPLPRHGLLPPPAASYHYHYAINNYH